MSRAVLITGGTGFIGSHIALRLAERGDRAILFDVTPLSDEPAWLLRSVTDRISVVLGSVVDLNALHVACERESVTDIIHAASIVGPDALLSRPREALDVNVGGTLNVLEAARQLNLRRLVYVSTIGVLPRKLYEPIDARHPIILGDDGPGAGFYGASKVASEAFCFSYLSTFGVDFVIIRPSAVYGLGMRVPNFIKPMVENSVRGEPTRFERGADFPRDYTHVTDVAELLVQALDAPEDTFLGSNRVFYAATGRPLVTAGQVAKMVRQIVPGADIEIGAGVAAGDLRKMLFRGQLDIAPACQQLGYSPSYVNLQEGVAEYVASYRQYLGDVRHDESR